MRVFVVFAALFALSACELRSQDDFDTQPFEEEISVSRPYQEVYADVLKGARKCWRPGIMLGTPNTSELETNLDSDLGYGEIYSYFSGLVFNPTAMVRIEKAGSGTLVRVKTGAIAGKQLVRSKPLMWAKGNTSG